MSNEAGVGATDARGPTSLAQVLAWESGRNQVDIAESLQLANIPHECDVAEPSRENAACAFVYLAEQFRVVTCLAQAEFDSADAGEETGNAQGLAASL